ncbi:erythroferrone [Saccopteryx bilineata]|uniref:erythroferrone n=1 Tax=Saccopteryx bilineata TaxID=59482 RepID=UPI00338D5A1D
MASTGVHLLLVCAGLLAAAAATGLGSRGAGALAGSRARKEPLPASAGESHGGRDTPVPTKVAPPTSASPKPNWGLHPCPGHGASSEGPAQCAPPALVEPTTCFHREAEKQNPRAWDSASTTQRTTTMDPRETWLLFLGHSDKNTNTNRGGRGRGRKLKVSLPATPEPYNLRSYLNRLYSPEELQKQLYLLQKGAECVEQCEALEEQEEAVDSGLPAGRKRTLLRPRARLIEAAFHCRLGRSTLVDRRTLQELSLYDLQDDTPFHRGSGLNLTTGQYTAPVAGFYALAATLHVGLPERRSEVARPRDRLRLLICIQSRCQRNDSLETVMGLRSSSDLFTISVNGVLYLQMGQYTSVFLDNASGSVITVQSGSQFSAVLLGV